MLSCDYLGCAMIPECTVAAVMSTTEVLSLWDLETSSIIGQLTESFRSHPLFYSEGMSFGFLIEAFELPYEWETILYPHFVESKTLVLGGSPTGDLLLFPHAALAMTSSNRTIWAFQKSPKTHSCTVRGACMIKGRIYTIDEANTVCCWNIRQRAEPEGEEYDTRSSHYNSIRSLN
eukprot:Filipodium_phascolosomae@DN2341_c0_g1_i1.p1